LSTTDPTLLSNAATQIDGEEAYCSACGHSFSAETSICPNDGARLVKLAAQRDDMIGKVLDNRYEIRAPLGKGGMGTVYRGWQLSVDREVAIKVIHPKLSSDRAIVKRFLREARIASRLSQPNIVNVYDFGQSEQVLYLVMELLRGHTLADELAGNRPINMRRTAVIGAQLCDALEGAHAQGIVHRDLKPGNIMILDDPPGRDLIKVLDFGLAKSFASEADGTGVTSTSAIIGTPLYMAPEQIEGKPSDQRADLYSLGCILYEMLSGAAPFVDPVVSAVLARHIADTPAALPQHVPVPMRALVEKLLAKQPDDRLRGAREVRQALETVNDSPAARFATPILVGEAPDTVPDVQGALAETDMALETQARAAIAAAAAATASQDVSGATPPKAKQRYAVIAFFAIVPIGVLAFVLFRAQPRNEAAKPNVTPGVGNGQDVGGVIGGGGGGSKLADDLGGKGLLEAPPDAGMTFATTIQPDAALPVDTVGGPLPLGQSQAPKVSPNHVADTPSTRAGHGNRAKDVHVDPIGNRPEDSIRPPVADQAPLPPPPKMADPDAHSDQSPAK
jgi:tRNA A-37 threonylcarbamoyl transferase component Bud32